MASEVFHRHTATGDTLYFTIRATNRKMWSTSGTPDFEDLTVGNWGNYAVTMSESPASSYFYVGTFPAISGNMVAGWYAVEIFKRAGGSPAISDVMQSVFFGYWDGTTFRWWGGDTVQVDGSATAATRMKEFFAACQTFAVEDTDFTPTTTVFECDSADDYDRDWVYSSIWWTSGANEGTTQFVSTYSFADGKVKLTVSEMETAPSDGDTFIRIGRSR
jgi:hypothetical protein